MACDSACRGHRFWPTGSTRIPPAASCWDAIARPPPRSACCSSTARSARPIGPWSKADPEGQKAVTNWKVRGRGNGLAWLDLEPVTGRTHQLRVHTSATGWPIVGDNIYGTQASLRRLRNEQFIARFGEPTLHLHSREIVIPISKNR